MKEELKPMFKEAIETNKWFYCKYYQLYFTPQELAKENKNGKFMWGPVNWELRDPYEGLRAISKKMEALQKEYDAFDNRIVGWQILNRNNYSKANR